MQYFTFTEFERSTTAYRYAIDNTIPTETIKRNIAALVDNILDPLRKAWGKPLAVTSGYRCPALNARVGGAKSSHHLRGMAADITAGNPADNRKLFDLARSLNLPFTQLIDEKGYSWVHISHDPAEPRHQVLHL